MAYDPVTKTFGYKTDLNSSDLNLMVSQLLSLMGGGGSAPISYSATPPLTVNGTVISLAQSGATPGQALVWSGTAWAPTTISGGVSYTLPAATTSLRGGVRPDGTTITISGDVISAVSSGGGSPAPVTVVIIDGATISGSTASPYQMLTTDRLVVANKTTGAATKVLLPTSPTLGVDYKVKDGKGDAGTNPITIAAGSGVTIEGGSTFVANANGDAITLSAQSATVWWIV